MPHLSVYLQSDLSLYVFTTNGQLLCGDEVGEKLYAMRISDDGRFLLTGGALCALTVRRLHSLEPIFSLPPLSSAIRSIDISPDQKFVFVGTEDGTLAVCGAELSQIRGDSHR
jgi:WD40 repeat protein